MRLTAIVSSVIVSLGACLSGCGTGTSSQSSLPATGNATVNLVVTDTPPTNITVLSFQVQISGAVLQPGNVSLLPRPVTVDLAQLATDTGFLASSVIGSGTYTSMSMTLANPQVTLMNNTSAALTLSGQTCAAGATCTFVPALNNASVTISNGIFPLSVTASSTTGLNLDLSIPDLLQSDVSVTLANGSSLDLSLLPQPSSLTSQQAEIDDVFGTVTQVNGSQVTMTTAFGDTLVLTSSSSTKYKYPSAVCSASAASCLTAGQIVTADVSLLGNGALAVNDISYAGAAGAQVVKGLVLSVSTSAATPSMQVLLQRSINSATLSAGQVASVSIPSGSSFSVGVASSPGVAGGLFQSPFDLMPGQELVLAVAGSPAVGSSPSFSTNAASLESSQVIGQIASVNPANTSFTMNSLSGLFTGSRPVTQQVNVQADGTTEYLGLSISSFSNLPKGQLAGAKGPLFNTTGTAGSPSIGAIQVRARTSGSW